MVTAWFDRHLKGLDSGTEEWPTVQVQGSDGQWRAEPDWPGTRGPAGRLALGASGALGANPAGETTYNELGLETTGGMIGDSAVFDTGPLPGRLELTGQPVLDAWIRLDRPAAHIAAKLEAFGPDGRVIPHARSVGLRSARYLEPLVDGFFQQPRPVRPPAGRPFGFASTRPISSCRRAAASASPSPGG